MDEEEEEQMEGELEENPGKKKTVKGCGKFVKKHYKAFKKRFPGLKPTELLVKISRAYWGKKANPKKRKRKSPKRKSHKKTSHRHKKRKSGGGKKKTPMFDGAKYTKKMHKHGGKGHGHRHKGRAHKHNPVFMGYADNPPRLEGRKVYHCDGCGKDFVESEE